jgi:uncharacterized protein YjbI with pentapeptide repeats
MFMEAQMQGALLDDAQLQGAMLNDARLQGASLRGTQLEAAYLLDVQLQGADLSRAELQGAQLIKAQLQGANLDHAQLQGAVFIMVGVPPLDAQLDGASLRQTYVWRTYPPSTANRAFVNEPEPGPKYSGLDCPTGVCQWSEKSYAALKSLIEYSAPRDVGILSHIAALEKPPYVADDASARLWADVAARTPALAGSYSDALARTLIEIGCAGDGAPYVIGALLRRIGPHPVRLEERFAGDSSKAAQVAGAFLDGEKCPGARRLSEENKTKLREIRDRGLPASATPGAAAR